MSFPMKMLRLCLNETCSTVRVGKYLSDIFPIRNGFELDVLSPFLFNFVSQVNQDGLK